MSQELRNAIGGKGRSIALLAALAACGTSTDDRPQTLPYITVAILQPTCGKAECHSSFRAQVGDVFDTVDAARKSIVDNGLIVLPDDQMMPTHARLIQAIYPGLPSILDPASAARGELIRMPYDAPMPNKDVELLENWIAGGAKGAQCVPAEGNVCVGNVLTACDSDGNIGASVMTCANGCMSGACNP